MSDILGGRSRSGVKNALAGLVFVGALGLFLLRVFIPSLTAMTHSFPAYYTASRLVIEGRWDERVYDDPWFEAQVLDRTDGRVSDHMSLHPPTTSLLLVPLASLDLTQARIGWQLFNLSILFVALGLLLYTLNVRSFFACTLSLTLALLYPPLVENIRVGQVYVLVLFLFVVSFWSELRLASSSTIPSINRVSSWVTGLGLGIAAGLKLSGLPIWLLLAVRGRWLAMLAAVLVTAATAVVGWVVLGSAGWLAFFHRVLGTSYDSPITAHVAYQTTPSFILRMLVGSAEYRALIPGFEGIATLLTAFGWIVSLGATLWVSRRASYKYAFAASVTLGVILFPMALEYHYTLLLLPLAVMGFRVLESGTLYSRLAFLLIMLLLYVPMDWNAPLWREPYLMLLGYPRLYAGWLLWIWLFKQMYRPAPARLASPSAATP